MRLRTAASLSSPHVVGPLCPRVPVPCRVGDPLYGHRSDWEMICGFAGSGGGMQRSEVIGSTRRGGAKAWWSRLPAPFQPASSGPVRYWQDRGRVAAKCALAAMAAWALARYAAGQPDPYFAPLAALLGVSPTVARSVREGLQYVAGFVLGAVLAIPVALILGPSIAGIAVVVLAGVAVGSW